MAESVDLREASALLLEQSSGIDRQSAESLTDRRVANPEFVAANPRLVDQVRRAIGMAGYAIRTEEACHD